MEAFFNLLDLIFCIGVFCLALFSGLLFCVGIGPLLLTEGKRGVAWIAIVFGLLSFGFAGNIVYDVATKGLMGTRIAQKNAGVSN